MLTEICAEIKNYFVADKDDIHIGDFTISDGAFVPPLDFPTDYIRIVGSHLNDGVHKLSDEDLQDEEFHGGVWIMSPPADFLNLVEDISNWQTKNGGPDSAAMSPFSSESFGGYSYSKYGVGGNSASTGADWVATYASRLSAYRKVRAL